MSGKGRGRGWLNIEKSNNERRPGAGGANFKPRQRRPYIIAGPDYGNTNTFDEETAIAVSSQFDHIVKAVSHFNSNDDGILLNQKFAYVVNTLEDLCPDSDHVGGSMDFLYWKALTDSTFTDKFATFVSLKAFPHVTINGNGLRKDFLILLQESYQNSKNMHQNSPQQFKNAVKIITSFYGKATMKMGGNYDILAPPILQYFVMLLDSVEDEDIQLFTTQFNTCGLKLIEDSINLQELHMKMRTKLTSNSSNLTENAKQWLLLAIELFNNEFRVLPTDLLNFYQIKLGSLDLFNFKKPLTVECSLSANNKLNEYSSDVNVLEIDTNVSKLHVSTIATSNKNKPRRSPLSAENSDLFLNGKRNQSNQRERERDADPQPQAPLQRPSVSAGRPILGAGARTHSHSHSAHTNKNAELKSPDDTGVSNWLSHKDSSSSASEGSGGFLRKPKKGWEHDDRFETDYN